MAITDNPFLAKTFQTIEMIANNNRQIQGEERRDDRLQEREVRAEKRFFERQEKQNELKEQAQLKEEDQAEFDDVINEIFKAHKAQSKGAKAVKMPDGSVEYVGGTGVLDEAKQQFLSERAQTLQKGGNVRFKTPEMLLKPPEKDKASKTTPLPDDAAEYFNLKEVPTSQYRQYIKDFNDSKKPAKPAGKSGGASAAQKNINDPLIRISDLRKRANQALSGIREEGDNIKLGISREAHTQYLQELQELETKFRNKTATEADSTALNEKNEFLIELADFQKEQSMDDEDDAVIDELLEAVKSIRRGKQ